MRTAAVSLATVIAVLSATASAQAQTPSPVAVDAAAPAAPAAAPAAPSPADAGAKREAELAASQRRCRTWKAQVIELRRIIEAMDRSRASVDDLRRRLDELEARLGENDRRDEALAGGAGREATLFKFRDDGFALRSPHGRFLLVPHLRVQTVYTGAIASRGTMDTADPRHVRVHAAARGADRRGHVGSRIFTYRLQLDAAESPTINDAYAQVGNLTMVRGFGVRVGQFKIPYGLQRQTWSGELEFVDISSPMSAFSLDRDIGVMVLGRPLAGRLAYELAVTNGTGGGKLNENIDLAYSAQITASPWGPLPPGEGDLLWHPQPRASIGVAGYYNLVPTDIVARTGDPTANTDLDRDGRFDNTAVWQGGAELRALWRGAALQAEWFGRTEVPGRRNGLAQLHGCLPAGELLRHPRAAAGRRAHRRDGPAAIRFDARRSDPLWKSRRRAERGGERLSARATREGPGRLHALAHHERGDGPGRRDRPHRAPRPRRNRRRLGF
jgi:hypothetical protein